MTEPVTRHVETEEEEQDRDIRGGKMAATLVFLLLTILAGVVVLALQILHGGVF